MDDYKNRMKEYISNLIKSEITALDEKAKRDYKDEYKKFQSSPKAKKYRAELNKYNRKKGTYGNGDGKDASHKGGKIVGFEAQSKNRGRAEKSRLKKEDIGDKFLKQRMAMLRRFFDQNYGRVKKAVERDARTGSNEFRGTDNRGEKFKLTIVINRLKELRNKLQKKDRGLADFFTKNIKVIEKTKDKMKEGVNENNMAHVYSKDLSKKKFKDLGVYLWHVLDLAINKDFRITSNGKLLAVNVDKINPKSLQNIKKRFGVDLQQLANESINEYTYGVGDIVKDINPTCPHNGAMGKVKSISPKSVVFVVMNKGKNYQPGDVLDKTHDQMEKIRESVNEDVYAIVDKFNQKKQDYDQVYFKDNNLNKVKKHMKKMGSKYGKMNLIKVKTNGKMSLVEISSSEAKTLLKQLGGRRFMMMVGAKGIARDKDGLHMKIGKNSKSISHVVIDYNRGKDLYDMKFLRVRMSKGQMKVKVVKQVKGIYADMLHDTFEKHTGLYTRM